MTTLFDQETIMKNHDAALRKEVQNETRKKLYKFLVYRAL